MRRRPNKRPAKRESYHNVSSEDLERRLRVLRAGDFDEKLAAALERELRRRAIEESLERGVG